MNYQLELEKILKDSNHKKKLLLHSCCAPCSSYVLMYLRQHFEITVYYYNPNISEQQEYKLRVKEQIKLISLLNEEQKENPNVGYPISFIEGDYEPDVFFSLAKGYETCAEGGVRCFRCYETRLRKTAELAVKLQADYFATTLTISPLKNAQKLNEIGQCLEKEYLVKHLPSDFKKKNGYKQSVELSEQYHLYRQDYCGCIFSKREREHK